jgi:WD40 repeat protein
VIRVGFTHTSSRRPPLDSSGALSADVSAVFTTDGQRIVTALKETAARLWETGTETPLALMRHNDLVSGAAFSADGRFIVTTSQDNTARLWDTGAETPIATMRHDDHVLRATFSADGRRIVTASSDKTARLWDIGFFLLDDKHLINTICRDILNVDINAPPRDTDLSRLTDEELQMAAVIDPDIERDVCRPPTRFQRFLSMFGFGG